MLWPQESPFIFVTDANVPPTNNATEWSLRHPVTIRKITRGNRSAHGTAAQMTLASFFGTWRLHGVDPVDDCHALLISS